MVIELVVEAAVRALMRAVATDVWSVARDRLALALRPADPVAEGLRLDSLVQAGDESSQRTGLQTHLMSRLREHPDRLEDLSRYVGDLEQILIEARLVRVDAHTVYVYGASHQPSDAIKMAVMQAARAANELDQMPQHAAITLLAAMPTEAAAKRLALMTNALAILSNMDEQLAADLLSAMPPPAPAQLLGRIDPAYGVSILAAMPTDAAVQRMAELTELDPGRAALFLFSMERPMVAQLLAELRPPHPAEMFERMGPDLAGAILATMSTKMAAWRISEISRDHAAQILSKMDRTAAVALLSAVSTQVSIDLLQCMVSSDGAEVLARVDIAVARSLLLEMDPRRALQLMVALRPPRSLVTALDDGPVGRLLSAAVTALVRQAEDTERIEAAQAYADRIVSEAEAAAQRMIAESLTTVQPVAAPPALGDRILEYLRRNNRQTLTKLSRMLREPESQIRAELARLLREGHVVEQGGVRTAVPHYSLR